MLDLVFQTFEDVNKINELWQHPENLYLGEWEILINEATGFNYIDEYKNSN